MDMKPEAMANSIEFCDSLTLRDINQIQSYGVLFALDRDFQILQYSNNIATLLDTPVEDLLGQSIFNFLKAESSDTDISTWLSQPDSHYKKLVWQTHDKKIQIIVSLHAESSVLILEVEKNIDNHEGDNRFFYLTQYVLSAMKNTMHAKTVEALTQTTCQEITKITGYDRVIIYQFNKDDQSGTVISEVRDQGMESYLGLRFPANDIPQSVRAMYLKLPLRYIPTIDEKPVMITPAINPVTNHFLDLSQLNLRMIAPVHVKYITNMKILSSTSIAIIQDDKLWGLIACHHRTAKYLSLNIRLILLLIANTIATQIHALESTTNFSGEELTIDLQTSLTSFVSNADSFSIALDRYHDKFMQLVSASGMSIYFQGTLLNYDKTPTHEQIIDLIEWLKNKNFSTSYVTSTLPVEYAESNRYKDTACGLLAIKITQLDNHYILFYKPERIHTIAWAGNPNGSLKCSETTYSPRDSFERFLQNITNQSSPWGPEDIRSADFIRSIIANKQLQDLLEIQVMHDPLTQLLNRLYLEERLAFEIQRAARERQPLTLILVDLDFFKNINDQFGHQAGDAVLQAFAELLKSQFREYDAIYRYGGEEFLIVLPGVYVVSASQKADMLRNEAKKLNTMFNGSLLPPVSVSLGISVYPQNGVDARSLIAAADIALYQAKKLGRDQAVVASVDKSMLV